jgi:hypothetical protein
MNINSFIESLASNNSRNFKIDQLNANSDNEVLREVVRLALDPFTQFYIRKIPAYTPNTGKGISLKFALDSIGDLSKRLVTGNAGIDHLRSNLEALNVDDAKVIERIIQKDLKCGVSVSTANAVWPDLVADYPCMLCSGYEQKLVDKIKFPAYAQLKMDGMRFNAIVRDGKCEFRSRNGKEILLLGNLEQEFISLAGDDVDCVFDGELMVMDPDDYQFMDRQTGNGILNKANKGTISAKEAAMVHATVWDAIPYEDFVGGKCVVPYSTRFSSLSKLIEKQGSKDKKIWLVTSDIVETQEQATKIFEGYLAQGLEGIILKDGSGIWENKRAKHQIKFKGELECDLKIVAVEEGQGKAAGMLGAIICESSDGVLKVRVGSGFNDNHRKTYWGENLIDKIVAVKYNCRISNKLGEESLFLPVFIELRNDKDVADHSKDIK